MKASGNIGAELVARTTFRLSAMEYVEEMFSGDVVSEQGGWKTLLEKDFDGKVTSADISSFVDEVHDICSKKGGDSFAGFDKAHVCAALFTKYKCTIDESMLGFILKSKTTVEPVSLKKKRFFLFRMIGWMWGKFKGFHNGVLDMLKIG